MTKAAIVQAQQRWEYMAVTKRSDVYLAKEMNEAGQSGWELVSVSQAKDMKGEMAWTAFLKRPAAAQAPTASAEGQPAGATSQPAMKPEKEEPADSGKFDLSGDEFEIKG
jgi:hypothetical protein